MTTRTAQAGPERIRRKLRRAGGSMAVVLPKAWLRRLGAEDEVELVESGGAILVLPVKRERSIEDEPEFAQFLAFVVLVPESVKGWARAGTVDAA